MTIDISTGLTSLLQPRSIAVVGASARRANAAGTLVAGNLLSAGFDGELHLVNPSGAEIHGRLALPSIRALPPVDAAVLAVPAAAVLDSLVELETSGCRSAIVPSSGLDAASLERIRSFAGTSGMIVHGPNCMGLVNLTTGTPLWIGEGGLAETPTGSAALITQSGSAAIFVARSAWPVGFSKIISTGNEVSVTTADYIDWLADDEATSVIALVVESIPDGRRFAEAARRAQEHGKPVIALKVGRSSAGARATTAHTGALLSSSRAYDAYFDAIGVPVLHDYDELASTIQLLVRSDERPRVTPGIGVLTISGGQAALAADLAEDLGIDLPSFSAETQHALAALMPDVPPHNPYDGGGSVVAPSGTYARVLRVLADAPEFGAVMVVLDAQSTLSEAEIRFEDPYVLSARGIREEGCRNPLVIASSSSLDIHARTLGLADGVVPVIRGIRNALVALSSAAKAEHPERRSARRPADLPSPETVAEWRSRISAGIDAELTRELLGAYGIPFVRSRTLPDETAAVAYAERLGYPVVVKVDSPDLPHRSDVGGVVLDIHDAGQLRAAVASICANVGRRAPDARILGYEVQRQVPSGAVEAFVGFTVDARIGGSAACGLGGTLVELLDDAATAHTPVDESTARLQIAATRLGALLDGHRNLVTRTDVAPLANVVARLSWMAEDLGTVLAEADLNPIMVTPGTGEVDVVDALLVPRLPAEVRTP